MRVISGKARGRRLKLPPESFTRPTADRVKEALFNIIGEKVFAAVFLDCFAGSGSIGIEALSRGAKKAHFVEKNPAVLKILDQNLEKTGFKEQSRVWKGDAQRILQRGFAGENFDIIFLDPPYAFIKPDQILKLIEENSLLKSLGIVILETSSQADLFDLGFWRLAENRVYGDTRILIWQKE